MIKLLGTVPTARAELDKQGEQVSPAEYNDDSYYAMSTRQVVGSPISIKPPLASGFSGVETYYYTFTDEADAKQQLGYDEETESFNVTFYPTADEFKSSRQQQLDNAIVTTQSGKQFDADEASIIRLGNALVAADGEPEDAIIKWSLANDGTGVMTDCTKAELREAHRLAMQNMSAIWSV